MDKKTSSREVFPHKLNYYCKRTGKAKKEICETLGIKYTTFIDWCRGKKYPRIDALDVLAQYFSDELGEVVRLSDLTEEKDTEQGVQVRRICEIAEEIGLSIRELAEYAGCSKSAMQRYVTGERAVPVSVIEGIAKHTNVSPAYIAGWVDSGNKTIMANNLKRQMARKGVSIREVSEALNIPYTTVRSWLIADTYPRIDKIEALSAYFGVSKSALIEQPTGAGELSPKRKAFIDKVMQMSDAELERLEQILALVEGTK